MKIVICEDEKVFSDKLVEYIREWADEKGVFIEIFEYTSAENFLFVWSENEDFDLVFLDIKMKTMTGVELAKQIRKTNDKIQIVFTTNRFPRKPLRPRFVVNNTADKISA